MHQLQYQQLQQQQQQQMKMPEQTQLRADMLQEDPEANRASSESMGYPAQQQQQQQQQQRSRFPKQLQRMASASMSAKEPGQQEPESSIASNESSPQSVTPPRFSVDRSA